MVVVAPLFTKPSIIEFKGNMEVEYMPAQPAFAATDIVKPSFTEVVDEPYFVQEEASELPAKFA